MAFKHAAHFVVADSVQLVVSQGRGLCVELVKAYGLVSIGQRCNVQRIGSVIHQHSRVAAQLREVDNVVIDVLVIAADAVVPAQLFRRSTESLNHFACPDFSEHASMKCTGWQHSACNHTDNIANDCASFCGAAKDGHAQSCTHDSVCHKCEKHEGQPSKNTFHCRYLFIG